LTLVNTARAMKIDVNLRKPVLTAKFGGLSGPAVKPVILRMVYQCARAVSIPVIGCGGISTARDAIEYMAAGATAVQVGTETFRHPGVMGGIIDGIGDWCRAHGFARAADLTGALRDDDMNMDRYEAVR